MRSFRQFCEGMANERIHRNASAATVKGVARTSRHGLARFVIDHRGEMHAGDAENFTHRDLGSVYPTRVRGWVKHADGGHVVMTDPPNSDHPHVQKLLKGGSYGHVHDPEYA